MLAWAATAWPGANQTACVAQEIRFTPPSSGSSITISGSQIERWKSGRFEVLHIRDKVEIRQQDFLARSNEAIVWVEIPTTQIPATALPGGKTATTNSDPSPTAYRVIAYLRGDAVVERDRDSFTGGDLPERDRLQDMQWAGELQTLANVDLAVAASTRTDPNPPAIFVEATGYLDRASISLDRPVVEPSLPAIGASPGEPVASVSRATWDSTGEQTATIGLTAAQEAYSPSDVPMMVSPHTGQLVPAFPASAVQESLPSIGDVPNIGTPDFSTPAIPAPTSPPFSVNPPARDAFPGGGVQQAPTLPPVAGGVGQPSGGGPQSISQTTGTSRINISARDSRMSLNFKSFVDPARPDERVSLGVGGVRISIDSPDIKSQDLFRGDRDKNFIILADSVVQFQRTLPDGSQTNEMYLEGNVVFAKDRRVINADRMFYSVERAQGTILKAEVLTPVADYRGLLRLKADVIRQIDDNNLQAFNTAFTSSRMGVPRYWLQSRQLDLTRTADQQTDPETGQPLIDPVTGQPEIGDDYFAAAAGNRVYVGGVPIFAWPRFTSRLSDPSIYLTQFSINNDRIFGTQVHAGFDLYQVLGFKSPPKGTQWTGVIDYLSERGLGAGTEFDYARQGLFGIPGAVNGRYRSWFINDTGQDQLGRGRFNLTPEEDFRGRIVGRHRHRFAPGYSLRAELGYITDRNFLEQFYEREWDTDKDATTGLWLERNFGTQSYNLTADVQVNDFFTQTSWLPRLDQFTIGQPILGDRAIVHSHSHAGYARMRVADPPTNAVDAATFDPLAWEQDVDGVRVGNRTEIDFPLQLGPTKVVPYAIGDVTYWQEALDNNDLFRATGQVGVRASVPVWKIDPAVRSTLLNLNGLAHKVSFDFDAFVADSSQDLDELPLYDPLDDDAQEHFRRRFAFNTFGIAPGGNTPLRYDERNFAFRSGLQSNVTSPSAEIADDLAMVKFGVRQRFQTKRGAPGAERITDLVNFNMQAAIFPKADRDNFGEELGMINYDFRWHIGDRLSLVSDGYADVFSQGLRTVSVGAYAERPEVGNVYIGLRSIEGPISSNVLSAVGTYRLSDKWGLKGGAQVDFSDEGTIGQRAGVVYIGESFLLEMAINYDVNRDNVGFRFGFEPRFTPRPKLFRPGGVAIAPASSRWLE